MEKEVKERGQFFLLVQKRFPITASSFRTLAPPTSGMHPMRIRRLYAPMVATDEENELSMIGTASLLSFDF